MYNIIEEINSLHCIVIKDSRAKDSFIPISELHVKCYYHEFDLPVNEDKLNEVDGIYNNITITSKLLNGELILLQDYGDHEGLPPEDTIDIPRWLLYADNGSIGWYDGYLIYATIIGQDLTIHRLINYEKIDLNIIQDKRPFSMWTVTKDQGSKRRNDSRCFL